VKFDAIVIGAGPAGSATALSLARSGARVLVVERSNLPREKACGDGLTPRALAMLSHLGVETPDLHAIDRVRLTGAPSASPTFERWNPIRTAGVLSRYILDERLASAAASAGAELRTGVSAESLITRGNTVCGARLRDEDGKIEGIIAPLTIIASGAFSSLRTPRQRQPTGFAMRRYYSGVNWEGPATFEIILPLEASGIPIAGYGWAFPMAGGRANVGVGYCPSSEQRFRLPQILRAFEESLTRDDPRFSSARPDRRVMGAPFSAGGSADNCVTPGLFRVGDAAGLANPYLGDGIAQALESGMAAAAAALAHLDNGAPLSLYGAMLKDLGLVQDRVGDGLHATYRLLGRTSRDIVPFLKTEGAISNAVWSLFEGNPISQPLVPQRQLERDAREAAATGRRMACRDRPILNGIARRLEDESSSGAQLAGAFLEAHACISGQETSTRRIIRIAACLELVGLAALLLDDQDLDVDTTTPDGSRGGDWLAATLGLSVADSILARCFSISARIGGTEGPVLADAILEIMERLTERALNEGDLSNKARQSVLASASARAGALVGGASQLVARDFAVLAAETVLDRDVTNFQPTLRNRLRELSPPQLRRAPIP